MLNLIVASAYFLLIHFGVSGTKLRDTLVARLGEGPYRGVRARFATRIGLDGLRVPARADHTPLGTRAWISTGRVRAGVNSLHLRGRWACDAESDAGWHGVKAGARVRHRAGDGSHYPPPVSVGGSALGAGPPHRQRRSRIPDSLRFAARARTRWNGGYRRQATT